MLIHSLAIEQLTHSILIISDFVMRLTKCFFVSTFFSVNKPKVYLNVVHVSNFHPIIPRKMKILLSHDEFVNTNAVFINTMKKCK